jgi:hypothetical protein
MEKLLNLLKQYWKEKFWDEKLSKIEYEEDTDCFYWIYQPAPWIKLEQGQILDASTVFSKRFQFVQWLVENKKLAFIEWDYKWRHFNGGDYEDMIMLLSIHDEPVTMLASFISK